MLVHFVIVWEFSVAEVQIFVSEVQIILRHEKNCILCVRIFWNCLLLHALFLLTTEFNVNKIY